MPFIIVLIVALLLIGWLAGEPFYIAYRRRAIRSRPFPDAWRAILRQRVPYFRRLPADLQIQLKKHMQVFIAEKNFIGCDGLTVTDEMRITIAAQACLLLLNRRTDYYPKLRQILIYPGPFIVAKEQRDDAGVLHRQRRVLIGESWSQGQIVLSWDDIVEGAAVIDDGRNVVIHEFAHQLDQQAGYANGAPRLANTDHYISWSQVLSAEFDHLQQRARLQQPSLLSDYGATDPVEFFAVASEVFFEQPLHMMAEHPALYNELSRFYCVHPASW